MDKLVIIPTYNEKENIENILKAVFELEGDFNILIVDDGSRMELQILFAIYREFTTINFFRRAKRKARPWYCLYTRL
ncbi:glycosyltransferase [Niabella ginsengisoli]|uniref:glycosyltransferase n=1 Tax=Niabella ginsengisoli TaxID=522298 RepID=UPI00374DB6ED